MDSWFASQDNFEPILSKHKPFVAALKDNRPVALSQADQAQGRFVRADSRHLADKQAVRDMREDIERRFKSGGINVLSATPTLEMGFDIGDLSSVLQCSVPPRQANYIQRAGRAGRSTGNALLLTMATSKPHDLFFWDDPKTMIAGSVQAPGIFLNASAVLERQLTVFTLDGWVRETG